MNFAVKRISWKDVNFSTGLTSSKNENSNQVFIDALSSKGLGGLEKYPNIAQCYNQLIHYFQIEPDSIIFGFGADQLLKDLFVVLDYNSIQIFNHSYELATVYNQILNKSVLLNDYIFDGEFKVKTPIESVGGDILYLVNPHCPTGIELYVEEIEILATKFKYIIIDETYTNPLNIDHRLLKIDNVIVVKSFSKIGGVPGLRFGYCLANKSIIDKLRTIKPLYEMNSISVKYLNYILHNPQVLDDHLIEMGKTYDILKAINGGFSVSVGNFATFEHFGKLSGKFYSIDGKTFVRTTLTDVDNYKRLLL
jgi:histidinol-phosphate aminotransferase